VSIVFNINGDECVCIGCGRCEAVCRENFEMVDGKASVKSI